MIQAWWTQAFRDQEAEERADGDGNAFQAPDGHSPRASEHISADRSRIISRHVIAQRLDKRLDPLKIGAESCFGETMLLACPGHKFGNDQTFYFCG